MTLNGSQTFRKGDSRVRRVLTFTIAWAMLVPLVARAADLPTNNDPENQLRFSTANEADARRNQLIRFIWPDGLPNESPTVTRDVGPEAFAEHLALLEPSLISRVDRLETNVLGFVSLAYLLHPVAPSDPPSLAIVQAGHSKRGDYLEPSYTEPIHLFLERGYAVVMLHMPLKGWHDDGTAVLPNGAVVDPVTKHDEIVMLPEHDPSLATGAGFRPFLEPVVACINHWVGLGTGPPDVTMVGLSGGGWTTHMAAALDTRIRLSIPVAGSYPLYLRNGPENRGSVGDLEQFFSPLYDENIAEDGSGGGVATWLEIYALGGYGEERKQVMVTAPQDSCCFYGDPATTVDTFKEIVADSVAGLGKGEWSHVLDTTHEGHMISPWVVENVIEPNTAPPTE